MIKINGYKPIKYTELQELANKAKNKSGISNIELCMALNLKSVVHIKNGFNTKDQIVKDRVLTKLHKCLGIDTLIVYSGEDKMYFVKK